MGPANLDHLVPLGGLPGQDVGEPLEGRNQARPDLSGHRHVNRRGEHVIGALPHVHMVVGMDRLVGPKPVAARQLDGPIADHLVGVHVAGSARTGLIDVHRKLIVQLALGHFAAGGQQGLDLRVGQRPLAAAGQLAQVPVGDGGRVFYLTQSVD